MSNTLRQRKERRKVVVRGRGKETTAKDCKQTLGMNGNVVCLDCDAIFTLTTETVGEKSKC